MKNFLVALTFVWISSVLVGCSFRMPGIVANDCTAAHGGDPFVCERSLNLNQPRPAKGMSYHSAGTMSLAHATCVMPNSQWWFHGAHIEHTNNISEEGNRVLMAAYSKRYPAVAEYLERIGSLQTVRWTKMTGRDLNRLGVPLCDNPSS